MVHILPKVQGFGERIGTAVGSGLGGGFQQGMTKAQEFAEKMKLQKEKESSKSSLYSDIFKPKDGSQKTDFNSLSPEQEAMLALEDPKAFTAYSHLKQSREKEQETVTRKGNLEKTLSEMKDTLLEGNLGYTGKRFTPKGRRDVQYFNTLGTQLESIGKDMVSKGVLSAPRFAYLLGNLPSGGKTDAANAGALEAWAKELDLNIPGIEDLQALYKSKEDRKKVQKGTKLDLQTMQKLYKKTGGDKEKMKKVAEKMGYDIQ